MTSVTCVFFCCNSGRFSGAASEVQKYYTDTFFYFEKKSMSKVFYKKIRKIPCHLFRDFLAFLDVSLQKQSLKKLKKSQKKHPPTYLRGRFFVFFQRPLDATTKK
jgi:hypothetical protein